MNSFDKFVEKYNLDKFSEPLDLKGQDKVEFYNDLTELMKTNCRIYDKLSNIFSLRGAQVLMSLAKLPVTKEVINKTDVMNSLNIDRREKLLHAFEYLKEQNYIKIKKKTSKFHIVKLNEEDNPDFKLFREVIQKYWTTPEEEKKKSKKWRDQGE